MPPASLPLETACHRGLSSWGMQCWMLWSLPTSTQHSGKQATPLPCLEPAPAAALCAELRRLAPAAGASALCKLLCSDCCAEQVVLEPPTRACPTCPAPPSLALLSAAACSGATPSQMHDMRSVAVNAPRLAFAGKLWLPGSLAAPANLPHRNFHWHQLSIQSNCACLAPALPSAAVKHGLHAHVRHQSPRLFTHITGRQPAGNRLLPCRLRARGQQTQQLTPKARRPYSNRSFPLPRNCLLCCCCCRFCGRVAGQAARRSGASAAEGAKRAAGGCLCSRKRRHHWRPHWQRQRRAASRQRCHHASGAAGCADAVRLWLPAHPGPQGGSECQLVATSACSSGCTLLPPQQLSQMRKSSTLLSNPFQHPCIGACGPCRFPSQVLSDVVESLMGAVYVDSRGDLDTTWAVAQVRRSQTALSLPSATIWAAASHAARLAFLLTQLLSTSPSFLLAAAAASGAHCRCRGCWTHW